MKYCRMQPGTPYTVGPASPSGTATTSEGRERRWEDLSPTTILRTGQSPWKLHKLCIKVKHWPQTLFVIVQNPLKNLCLRLYHASWTKQYNDVAYKYKRAAVPIQRICSLFLLHGWQFAWNLNFHRPRLDFWTGQLLLISQNRRFLLTG